MSAYVIRYRSAVSGLWYQNPNSAGDYDAVEIGGSRLVQGAETYSAWVLRATRWIDFITNDEAKGDNP